MKDENKCIKEENIVLKKKVLNLSQRVKYILEQKSLECHVEIIGVLTWNIIL